MFNRLGNLGGCRMDSFEVNLYLLSNFFTLNFSTRKDFHATEKKAKKFPDFIIKNP